MVSENRVLRRMSGTKRDEIIETWRELHRVELHNWDSLSYIIRMIRSKRRRWAGHVACRGARRSAYRVLVGKLEGKRLVGKPRHRWEDNIKTDFREIGYGGLEWIHLVQDRDKWQACVHNNELRVP
jgi:hypothetical protein